MDGRIHEIPQVRTLMERGVLPAAMQIRAHINKLECYSCHARWVPQCYGCHAKMDLRKKGFDWVDERNNETFSWEESRSYLRWESPVLGINSEGKVSPFTTGCQVIFTRINKDGRADILNKVFINSKGHYGIAQNPIQPHTISRRARTCEDCHSNPKTLGLGYGCYVSRLNGVDIPFELERIVDEDGNQIQGTSHVGARPFNRKEMERIRRINVCLSCHKEHDSLFWEGVEKRWGTARNNKAHREILNSILRKAMEK